MIILKTRSEVKVRDTPPSQDASTHQIWNSYLKEYRIYAQDTKWDGRMDGLTDGRTDSAITICLPNFFFGHKKGEFFARSSHYRWLWLLSLDNAADLLLFIHVYYCIICLWVRCLVLVLLCGI